MSYPAATRRRAYSVQQGSRRHVPASARAGLVSPSQRVYICAMPRKNAMHEMTAETATKLFLAQEEALDHAAAKIYRLLTQDAGLTPAECFVVCLRAAAKFLAQHDKDEWREIIQHASELLLQHAILTNGVSGDSAYAKQNPPARGSWWPWRRG